MATPITWRNVGSNSNGAANRLIIDGLDTVNDSFGGIKSALKDVQGDRKATYDHAVDTNTQQFLNTVASYGDVDSLNQAQQTGVFRDMLAGFGTTVDQERTRNAVASQLATLQGRKTSEIAYNTALDNEATRQRNMAEAPIVQEFNRLLAAGKNGEAQAYLKANEGNLYDASTLYRSLEGEVRGDEEYARTKSRRDFEDGRINHLKELLSTNNSTASQYNKDAQAIFDKAGVTKEQYVSGSLPAAQFADIKGQLGQLQQPLTQEQLVKQLRDYTMNAEGARVQDLGNLDAYVAEAMNTGLSERQALEVQNQVDAYARANNIEPLSNNIFSTENQERLGGMNYVEGGSIIDKAFSEEDIGDWDYSKWKEDLVLAAINGIEISEGKTGETVNVKVPPTMLVDFLKSTKGTAIETDNQFKDALTDYLVRSKASKKLKEAKDLEAKQREFVTAAKAKSNANNPVYNANTLFAQLNTATPRQEVKSNPVKQDEVVEAELTKEEEIERIKREAKKLLENVHYR